MFRPVVFVFGLCLSFAALCDAQAQGFLVQPGDVLQITVWKEEGMDQETLVLPDGTLTFPLVGSVKAQDLSLEKLQDVLKEKLKPFIPDAVVTVLVKAPLGHTVNVLGQVAKPGEIVMQSRMSVMQALSQAGGLTSFADADDIVVLRRENGEKKPLPFPYDDVARGDAPDEDFDLKPGDIIVVPTAGLF